MNKEKSGCLLSFQRVTDIVKYKRNYNLSVFKLESINIFIFVHYLLIIIFIATV